MHVPHYLFIFEYCQANIEGLMIVIVLLQGAAPSTSVVARGRWRDAMTRSKREAIINCLKAVPFHKLKKQLVIPCSSMVVLV